MLQKSAGDGPEYELERSAHGRNIVYLQDLECLVQPLLLIIIIFRRLQLLSLNPSHTCAAWRIRQ